ncbi:dual specificity protein phosphatase 22-B-like isoform X2 [Scomber scombrus]|uniref:dual specificity protein phosphatase 22-B-like isoform X2 n=1 Tax=Scomber scombrus TaxID=13677 RepID=UPI002DDB098A|nr:dual specificity protein phosphatase 22-B-like isoform X2 [Scomber scombrus]
MSEVCMCKLTCLERFQSSVCPRGFGGFRSGAVITGQGSFWGHVCTISCQDKTYLCISASDHSKQNLMQYFRDSIMFIHESRMKGEGCLVHCVAGVSRSVTLVVVYIMTVTGRGWVESLAAVRAARPCAGPNLGFLRQLEEFENTELTEYRAWWQDRYGDSSFSDDEEVGALLTRKSNANANGSALATSITPSRATSGT